MPELMLVVSAEMKNVVSLQPQDGIDNETINYYFKCQGCERHGAILLIPGHGAPLSQHHCTEVDLMLFNCNGLLSVEYSFNGGWLAITSFGKEIHVDLSMGEYMDVIDGEETSITKLKAKFASYWS